MKKVFWILLLGSAFTSYQCTNKMLDLEGVVVQVNQESSKQKASDLLNLIGFTNLESNESVSLKGITKILFKDNRLVVLNYVGDTQDIWVFDQKTGKALYKIGKQTNEDDGYDGVNDITFSGDGIRFSASAKLSFMDYGMDGNLRSVTKSGIFGEELEFLDQGELVAYNEYNATQISGLNHLIFYDKKGNVTKRIYPYLPSQDGNGYAFAGSLTSSEGLWFNPPFCDTIFEIVNHRLKPSYIFDFNGKSMPENLRQQKMSGWDTNKFSFISDGLVKVGKFLVIKYHDDQRAKIGVYDETTNQFLSFRSLESDPLYELIQIGDLYPKDQSTFALMLRPNRIRYILNNNLKDLEKLNNSYPELVKAFKETTDYSNPIVLYLSFTANASIEKVNK